MRRLASIGALLIAIVWGTLGVAHGEAYVPALSEIMTAAQFRHIKLWFAGKHENWDLARYEIEQIKRSLEDAVIFYRGIPVEYVAATTDPIMAISEAIEAKDSAQFVKGFNDLTAACNSCHGAIGRGFVVIQTPTVQPFSDQSFAPQTPKQ
jgi:hypothetical protein